MDQTVFIELGNTLGVAFWVVPTASDLSGVADLISQSSSPGDEFGIGPNMVTYVFIDASGNTAFCQFLVIVQTGEDNIVRLFVTVRELVPLK